MTITANAIKELREVSGAGMMDCKKALTETNGNFEEAKDWLRSKGLAKAAKKASRVAAEGLIAIAKKGNKAIAIELNSETDFVAKNDQFQTIAQNIANVAIDTNGDVEAIKTQKIDGTSVDQVIIDAVAKIGENINLRRAKTITATGEIFTYVHGAVSENLGKIGVIVALKNGNAELGKQIAMHIAANKPESLNIESLDAELVEREKKIFIEQARESGKPDSIIEKMIEGRIRKYYEQVVLLEQDFVMNPDQKVKDVVKAAGAELEGFIQLTIGEGIEKEETDFAAEVKAVAGAGA